MPRPLHRVHRPFINGTTTALFCMCVSVCDVPVDKFAVCVWLLSACVVCVYGTEECWKGEAGEGVIFTTKSANGAKLLALQVCNAIAAKSTSKKKKEQKTKKKK